MLPRRSLRQYAEQLDEEIEVLRRQPFIKRRAVVARSADEEVHQAQSGALRSDEAEIIAPFVEGRNHGSSEVIRGHQRSSEVIAPFVEWHAVVTRTPEEVEDGLVLMRDAIRESIREHSGTQSEEVEDGLVLMRDAIRYDYGACTSLSSLALSRNHRWSSEAIRELSTEREVLTSFSSFALSRNRLSRTPYANWLNLSSAIEPPLPYSCTNWSGTKEAKL